MSGDAEVTAIDRDSIVATGTVSEDTARAEPDRVARLTRLGTGSCVMILDQILRNASAGNAADATDAATLARRMTRATRDFRAAATEISDR